MSKISKTNNTNKKDLALGKSEASYMLYRKLFYPTRLRMLYLIHSNPGIAISEISDQMGLTLTGIESSLSVLKDLKLISVELDSNPGHGQKRVGRSLLPESEKLTFKMILRYLSE